jgi:hypothetical protein
MNFSVILGIGNFGNSQKIKMPRAYSGAFENIYCNRLRGFQIPLQFPRSDADAVFVPLRAFGADESLSNRFAQGFQNDLILLQRVEGLGECARQCTDGSFCEVCFSQVIDVLVDRFRRFEFALDTIQARGQNGGEEQVRVAAGVRAAQQQM